MYARRFRETKTAEAGPARKLLGIGEAQTRCDMRDLLMRFVREEAGYVAGPEWACVATVLVLGAIAGVLLMQSAERPDAEPEPVAAVRSR